MQEMRICGSGSGSSKNPWRHLTICLLLICVIYLIYLVKIERLFNISKEFAPVFIQKKEPSPGVVQLESDENLMNKSTMTTATFSQPATVGTTISNSQIPKSDRDRNKEVKQKSTFSTMLEEFQWTEYKSALRANNHSLMRSHLEKLILQLTPWLAMEPLVPINPNCTTPPDLKPPEKVNCSNYPTGLTGIRNRGNSPIKIGVLMTFGFDLDVLEIYLHELYDVVDKFFILEAVRSTSVLAKPLLWEKVKRTPRFVGFDDKVVHFVLDDAEIAEAGLQMELHPGSPKTMRAIERLQEIMLWDKFLEWNKAMTYFGDDDVLCFGDSDEIPSRDMVNLLRYCQLKDERVDFGIWFPFGNIKLAFETDHPIPGHKLTFGNPGFWTQRKALAFANTTTIGGPRLVPVRTYGTAGNYLLGGMHMTHNGYLPYQIVKFITASEGRPFGLEEISLISNRGNVKELQALEFKMAAVPPQFWSRIKYLSQVSDAMKDIAVFPWFYNCNRERYPIWKRKHDTRIYMPE